VKCIFISLDEKDKVFRGNSPPKFHGPSKILGLINPLLFCKSEGSFHGDPPHHLPFDWIPLFSTGIEPLRASRQDGPGAPGLVGDLPVRIQTVNRFLPFILLRFKTLRPLLVLILSKKP
jgi:hypothetical protein